MNLKKIACGPMAALAVICVLAMAPSAHAQNAPATQKQLDLAAARAERKAMVGENMNLTPAEAKTFWPLYDAYEGKMDKIEDRHIKEVKDYAKSYKNLTDAAAAKKLDEVMQIAQARLDVQKEFIPQFRGILPGIKVTRFFQIDNKLRALVQCGIAQMVPLASAPEERSE
jgi:Spy/CpxP family protein refolding chaperone